MKVVPKANKLERMIMPQTDSVGTGELAGATDGGATELTSAKYPCA